MGLFTDAAFAIGSAIFGNKSRREANKANKAEADIQKIRNRQARRKFIRSFRQAQAAAIVGEAASGVESSSRLAGELSSNRAQTAFGLFENDQQQLSAQRAFDKRARAAKYGFVSDLISQAGEFASNNDIFKSDTGGGEGGTAV